ncbi:MAG: class I SAM-dependent methyltransferase [Promethearchaeota archaeon]
MRFNKEKVKSALKNPFKIPSYILNHFLEILHSKEQLSLNFFKKNYLGLDSEYLFKELERYWNEYRYFENISKFIKLDRSSFKQNKILDIGCGYTSVLNILPKSERFGIDIVINKLKKYNFPLNKEIKWINGIAEKLPFEDNYFDIIFCSNGIDHYENPKKVISEVKRVLKYKGIFILTIDVFNDNIGYRNKLHPYSYTESKILKELDDFKIIFKQKSPINAQFCRFIKNNIIPSADQKELILVMQLEI